MKRLVLDCTYPECCGKKLTVEVPDEVANKFKALDLSVLDTLFLVAQSEGDPVQKFYKSLSHHLLRMSVLENRMKTKDRCGQCEKQTPQDELFEHQCWCHQTVCTCRHRKVCNECLESILREMISSLGVIK